MFGKKKETCDHEWEILESYKFDSMLDKFSDIKCSGYAIEELNRRGVITVCKCSKCGYINHIRTEL